MGVNPVTMTRYLGRLSAAMGKPYSDVKIEAQASEYAKAMGHLPEFAVEWAVGQAIKDSDRYPKASTLRKLAMACPQLLNGNHDGSLRSQMRDWEASPWPDVWPTEEDRRLCRSLPCPVCGSCVVSAPRGSVVVHDDQRHREMRVSYSNIGKPEWFEMGPPVEPTPKPRKAVATRIGEILKPPAPPPAAAAPVDQPWDEEQQCLAAAQVSR